MKMLPRLATDMVRIKGFAWDPTGLEIKVRNKGLHVDTVRASYEQGEK